METLKIEGVKTEDNVITKVKVEGKGCLSKKQCIDGIKDEEFQLFVGDTKVRVVDNSYLRSVKTDEKKDNLGEQPEVC